MSGNNSPSEDLPPASPRAGNFYRERERQIDREEARNGIPIARENVGEKERKRRKRERRKIFSRWKIFGYKKGFLCGRTR